MAARLTDDLSSKKRQANAALQEKLDKKKAKKALQKTPEELLEEYLVKLRESHKSTLTLLSAFVESEKRLAIADCETSYLRPSTKALLDEEEDEDFYDDDEDDGNDAALAAISSCEGLREGRAVESKST